MRAMMPYLQGGAHSTFRARPARERGPSQQACLPSRAPGAPVTAAFRVAAPDGIRLPLRTASRVAAPGLHWGCRSGRHRVVAKAALGRGCLVASEVSAPRLLALYGLEQGLEVALAESLRPVPFDHLEEHRRPVLNRLAEDLQQVAVLVAVGKDLEFAQLVERDPGVANPLPEGVVIAVRRVEEVNASGAHAADRGDDVIARQRDVLDAGAVVDLQGLVDL